MKYIVAFSSNQDEAQKAQALFEIIKGWKSTKVLTKEGQPSSPLRVAETLECYKKSFTSRDDKSYCQQDYKILPSMENVNQFLSSFGAKDLPNTGIHTLPCKLLYGFALTEYSLMKYPDLLENLLQTAHNRSCIWCPNFTTNNYVRIYTKEEALEETTFIEEIKSFFNK